MNGSATETQVNDSDRSVPKQPQFRPEQVTCLLTRRLLLDLDCINPQMPGKEK